MSYGSNFACGCGDESRAQAEEWLREVLPGIDQKELRILTGEKNIMSYALPIQDDDGKNIKGEDGKLVMGPVEDHEYDEHRDMDLTETLLFTLSEEGAKRGRSYEVSIASDQWCGVSVTGKAWEKTRRHEEPVSYGAQYDHGLLPYALAKIILDIREEEPVEDDDAS